jgi:hypothetical protein
MAPDERSVAHAKRASIDVAPGPRGGDARIAAPCAHQTALQLGGAPSQKP